MNETMEVWTDGVQQRCVDDKEFLHFVLSSLGRFNRGDWGELCTEDKLANAQAEDEYRFASYNNELSKIYIIREHDGSATTILLPDEY